MFRTRFKHVTTICQEHTDTHTHTHTKEERRYECPSKGENIGKMMTIIQI